MKPSRLQGLLAVMVVLGVARVMAPAPSGKSPPSVAEAIVRKSAPIGLAPSSPLPAPAVVASASRTDEPDVPGDAFAARPPPAPPYVSPVPAVVAKALPVRMPVALVPAAPAEPPVPPVPPVPYQVIGTWDDGKEPGVFLSGPTGTVLARTGAMLQAEYRVTSITPQQISLLHVASQREVRLAITRPPNSPPAYP